MCQTMCLWPNYFELELGTFYSTMVVKSELHVERCNRCYCTQAVTQSDTPTIGCLGHVTFYDAIWLHISIKKTKNHELWDAGKISSSLILSICQGSSRVMTRPAGWGRMSSKSCGSGQGSRFSKHHGSGRVRQTREFLPDPWTVLILQAVR